jgi:hypothetical protein
MTICKDGSQGKVKIPHIGHIISQNERALIVISESIVEILSNVFRGCLALVLLVKRGEGDSTKADSHNNDENERGQLSTRYRYRDAVAWHCGRAINRDDVFSIRGENQRMEIPGA